MKCRMICRKLRTELNSASDDSGKHKNGMFSVLRQPGIETSIPETSPRIQNMHLSFQVNNIVLFGGVNVFANFEFSS